MAGATVSGYSPNTDPTDSGPDPAALTAGVLAGPAPGVARTPDACFADLADFAFDPHYVAVEAKGCAPVRMHYVDAGGRDDPVVLLLHGQPTWSYLYRKVIPELTRRGLRAIAPDNIGFGRSDKPVDRSTYTYRRHVDWMTAFVHALDLRAVTLVVQDWGGPIGLGALAARPERFAGVVATNTVLHTCDPALAGRLTWANHALASGQMVVEQALLDYVQFCAHAPTLVPSMFVGATAEAVDDDVLAAYDAPFPDVSFTAGLRQMTALIPLTPNDAGARAGRATTEALRSWERPFLTAYSDGDPATRGWEAVFQELVPGAAGLRHRTIEGAGHFVQEDGAEELGRIIADFVT